MEAQPSSSREITSSDAPASVETRDPLDVVTEFDVRALAQPCGVFRGTQADGIVRVNQHFLDITGLSPAVARGWDWLVAVHSEDRDRLQRAIDAACRTGAGSAFPIRVQVRLGVIETLRASIVAVPHPADGWVTGPEEWVFVGAVEPESVPAPRTPTTEPVDVESALSDPYEILVRAIPIAMAYAAPDGTIEFANDAWSDLVGVGVDAPVLVALGLDADDGTGATSALTGDAPWSGVIDSAAARLEVSVAPLAARLGGGHVVTVRNVSTDAERVQSPPSASGSPLDAFAALLDASPDFASVMRPDGVVIHLNPAARSMLGFESEESLAGRTMTELVEYDDADPRGYRDRALEALAATGVFSTRGEVVLADGTRRPVSILLFALKDADGGIDAIVTIARDGSDLRHAKQQVRERDQWYRALVQHSADVVAVVDADLRLTFVSPSCGALFGFDPETILGDPRIDLVLADDLPVLTAAIQEARSRPGPLVARYRAKHADGSVRYLETTIEDLLDDPIVGGIVFNVRDITDARAESLALDHSETALRTLVRCAPVAILAVDLDSRVQVWNPACEEIFGWTADEVIGQPAPFVTESQREQFASWRERVFADDVVNVVTELMHRDGTPLMLALSTAPVTVRDGSVTSLVMVAVDMTERVRDAEELARRAEVDRFIASVSRSLVDATTETLGARGSEALLELAQNYGAAGAALYLRTEDQPRLVWSEGGEVDLRVGFDRLPPAGGFLFPAAPESESGIDDVATVGGWVVAGTAGVLGVVALRWSRPADIDSSDLEPLEVIGAALIGAVERVDAENAVRASDQRFRTLAEHSTDLVIVVRADFTLGHMSPAASRFLGMAQGARFDPSNPIVHPDDHGHVSARMAEIAAAGTGAQSEPFVARFRRADGVYRAAELVVTNLLDEPAIGGIVINAHDISDQRAVEEQLRASESRFRGLVQNLAEGVTVLAADGSVKYSTPSAARMMGFDEGHGDGMLALDFIVEEDRERAAEIIGRAFSEPGIQGPISLRVYASDGRIRVVEALGHNRLDDPEVEGIVVTARDITERVEAEDAARRSDARLSALVENLSDVVTIIDPSGQVAYTSPAAFAQFGFVEGDQSWTDPMSRVHPDDTDFVVDALGRHVAGETQEPVRFRLRAADGTWRSVEAIARDMTDDPDVGGVVVTTRDVSARTRAETLVADQAKVLTLIARGAPLAATLGALCDVLERNVDDAVCGFLLVDQSRQRLRLGAGPRIPMEIADACHDIPIGGTEDAFGATAALGSTAVILDIADDPRAESLRAAAGRCGVAGIWSTPIFDSLAQRVIGTLAMFFDTSREPTTAEREVVQMFSQTAAIAIERQVAEDLLAHRANHDSLTGLPNRVLFLEFLSRALARSGREQSGLAVLFLDLDRFKHINDGLGHDAGDEVLRELGRRLELSMRPSDVVARFGGDEFTVLCEGLDTSRADQHVAEVARRLLDVVEQPLSVGGEDRRLSASLGIAIAMPDSTPDGLLRDADAAMYEAKERGKARWEVFDDDMRSSMTARLDLESKLERAIEREEFRLFLQPIIDLSNGRCVGAEALLRWHDPEIGLVTPDAFIGLAEETGLIIPIGEWALAEACRTVARWEEVGLLSPEFTMAVNLSARQVAQADLADKVRAVIAQSGPMASRLCLEITESVLMEESSVGAMHALRDLGVSLSIDDFGTGYSSLGYLKRFPVDSVKVDRSFVDGLGIDGEDSAIVAAVVSLGHALGLSVVAEGVETSGQLRELLALGCDRAQGYWFSGPRDPTEFAGLLNNQPWIDGRSSWSS